MDLVQQWIHILLMCGGSCALLMLLCPEGFGKTLLKTGCVCLMLTTFLPPICGQGFARCRGAAEAMQQCIQGEKQLVMGDARSFSRMVMEREYAAYILSEAKSQGVALKDVSVETVWDESGCWLPCRIQYGEAVPPEFRQAMEMNLGLGRGGEAH